MRRFEGAVSQVRLAPTTVQNVVTYTVIINAENPEEKLLPGMTASVQFQVDRKEGVLRIPNAALRFTPPEETPKRGARVWVQGSGGLSAVEIRVGLTDGSFTELVQGELKEGQEIVTGLAGSKDPAPVTNPFAPRGRMR
jgi:HlyD family secretion protein